MSEAIDSAARERFWWLNDWRHVKTILRLPMAWLMSIGGWYFAIWYIIVIEPTKPCFHWILGLPFAIGGYVMFWNDIHNRRRFNDLINTESHKIWMENEKELKGLSLKLPDKYRRSFLEKRRDWRHGR